MKKTISLAALAISASTSSLAFIGQPMDVQTRTYCLSVRSDASGAMMAGSCDQTANNAQRNAQIGGNGCAEGQISLTTSKPSDAEEFPIRMRSCMPPNIAQL